MHAQEFEIDIFALQNELVEQDKDEYGSEDELEEV